MHLSTLRLHGFKSFADETTLDFAPGITAIVGPNGCGKSNIVDAVRWVIGEQRPSVLRSDTMENVIFNGAAHRRAVGMAEVALTIENTEGILPTEYSEVVLGRRLYRSGTSEYLINRSKSRLKDIRSLFMDTGMGADAYSVIELKMVDEILSENIEDRRHLFEEAAGITKYKRRRRQALRKLDRTQADLDRVRDLTDEVTGRVERLAQQAEKAQQHQDLDEELKRRELYLAQAQHDRLSQKRRTLQEKHETLNDEIEELATQHTKAEAKQEALRAEQVEREQAVTTHQKRFNEHQEHTREQETERKLQQQRLDNAHREGKRLRREQAEAEERRDELNVSVERLQKKLSEARPVRDEAEDTLSNLQQERDRLQEDTAKKLEQLQTVRQREEGAARECREAERKLDRLTNQRDLKEQEQARLQTEARNIDQEAQELDERLEAAEQKLEATRQGLRAAQAKKQEAEREHAERRQTLEARQEELRSIERRRDAAASKVELLEELVESHEEFDDAVQYLMDHAEALDVDLRSVADLVGCDEAHRRALDAALGPLASALVVDTGAQAAQIRTLLREQDEGRAALLICEQLPEAPPDPLTADVNAQPLCELVRTAEATGQAVANALLRHCYLAPSWKDAQQSARDTDLLTQFFTLEGEWVSAGGKQYSGSAQEGVSAVAQRFGRTEQLSTARERLAQIESEKSQQQEKVRAARDAVKAPPLEQRREALQQAEEEQVQAEKERERLGYEQQTLAQRSEERAERREALQGEIDEARAQVTATEEALAEKEITRNELRKKRETVEATYEKVETAARDVANRYGDAQVEAVEARNRCDTLRREHERTQEALDDLRTRSDERAQRLRETEDIAAEAETAIERLTSELETLHRSQGELEEAANAAKNELAETKSNLDDIEQTLQTLRQERNEAVETQNESAVRLTEIETRLSGLHEDVNEDYDRLLGEDPVSLPDDFDEDATRQRVKALRNAIKKLGSVNPLALQEYDEEKERLDFLEEQKDDLEDAEDTLLETIHEINETAIAQFNETYEAIRDNFSRLFADLFGRGAKADLELVDPEEPLESPIEIRARPRGKRPTSIMQLSSGEKTLTAIALLFAIYLVKPSPFCILDEVDAPLDDANVERFMQLIRTFSEDTQFILITHNKLTMEAADRLYGVTMQEQGVSTLVGVELAEAAALVQS